MVVLSGVIDEIRKNMLFGGSVEVIALSVNFPIGEVIGRGVRVCLVRTDLSVAELQFLFRADLHALVAAMKVAKA